LQISKDYFYTFVWTLIILELMLQSQFESTKHRSILWTTMLTIDNAYNFSYMIKIVSYRMLNIAYQCTQSVIQSLYVRYAIRYMCRSFNPWMHENPFVLYFLMGFFFLILHLSLLYEIFQKVSVNPSIISIWICPRHYLNLCKFFEIKSSKD